MSATEGVAESATPDPNSRIELHNLSDVGLIQGLLAQGRQFDLIHADPPWMYRGGKNNTQRGLANFHYAGMSELRIALALGATAQLAKPDTYLICWCTFPKLYEWARQDRVMRSCDWEYVTGAVWGKMDNKLGVGYHLRGDAELMLIYKNGRAKPQHQAQSDFWYTDVPPSALWTAQRGVHSVKPVPILRDVLDVFCAPGGDVLNLYSGEAASLEIAARDTGRGAVGCELDPDRWAASIQALRARALWDADQYDRYATRERLEQLRMEGTDATTEERGPDARGVGYNPGGVDRGAPPGEGPVAHSGR